MQCQNIDPSAHFKCSFHIWLAGIICIWMKCNISLMKKYLKLLKHKDKSLSSLYFSFGARAKYVEQFRSEKYVLYSVFTRWSVEWMTKFHNNLQWQTFKMSRISVSMIIREKNKYNQTKNSTKKCEILQKHKKNWYKNCMAKICIGNIL